MRHKQGTLSLANPHPIRLLTNHTRTAVAVGLTTFVFALALRGGLHLGHTESGWLLPLDLVLHGWLLIAVNVAFYGYLCWLGFWFIRGTEGRERLFLAGWFANILLSPLEKLRPSGLWHSSTSARLDWYLRCSQRYRRCYTPRTSLTVMAEPELCRY